MARTLLKFERRWRSRNMWAKVDDLTNKVRTLRRQAFMAEKDYALDPRNEGKKMPQE